MPPSSICKLPELIDEPVAVFDSGTVQGALVVATTGCDSNGNGNLIVSVQANLSDANTRVNMITSAYSKPRPVWVGEQVAAGLARYADEKKSPGILEAAGPALKRGAESGSQRSVAPRVLGPNDLHRFRVAQRNAAFGAQ